MQKDAIISIKSFTELDKKDIIEVVTPGKFFVEGNMFKAVYEETEISGMAGTTTTLSITDEMFILEREGSTATKMEFKKEIQVFLYIILLMV